jgi:predicted nuclease of predicted toxin-antitoxin system
LKLKLLADVHISPVTVAELQKLDFNINRVTDYLSANASDSAIIDLARRKKAVIVTQDLDFSSLIAQSGLKQPSVVSLRVENAKPLFIARLLKSVLPLIQNDLINGSVVSVEENQFRIRRLPIS